LDVVVSLLLAGVHDFLRFGFDFAVHHIGGPDDEQGAGIPGAQLLKKLRIGGFVIPM